MENLDFLNEVELDEPLENSKLSKIIPSEDHIFYSGKLKVVKINVQAKNDKWISHVILTDNGVAFTNLFSINIQKFCVIRNRDFIYIPWHVMQYDFSRSELILGDHRFPYCHLSVIKDKDLDAKKPFKQRNVELIRRAAILIKKSKSEIYDRLAPILRTYPKGKIPKKNPSDICMLEIVYSNLRSKLLNELLKERNFQYPEKIEPVSNDACYTKEKIIADLTNFEFRAGEYATKKKEEELVIVFTNYFMQNSLEDSADLLINLVKINPSFFKIWDLKIKMNIVKLFPEKERDLFELESNLLEKTVFIYSFQADEHIIAHFKGTVKLPKAHFKYPGHIWMTNYRLYGPSMPKTKQTIVPDVIPFGRTVTGLIVSAINKHIVNAREEYLKILAQYPDMYLINKPYNIKVNKTGNLEFTMNFDYKYEAWKIQTGNKTYKLVIELVIDKYQKESNKEFTHRQGEIISKIRDFFSTFPETVCSNCNHVQSKELDTCEECNMTLNFKI